MKINEYLSQAKFFPLMGVSQLNDIGEQLDLLLKQQHGLRTCGSIIDAYVQSDGTVSESDQEAIAKSIYLLNKSKWDNLIEFAESELEPFTDAYYKTITTYGHIIEDEAGGKDTSEQTDKLAGFDSTDFVDDTHNQHETTYGKTNKTTNSGENVIESTKRNTQAERLVDYTLDFWNRYGLTRTFIADALRDIALPLYELD